MKLRSLAMTFAALVVFAAPSLAQITIVEGTVTGVDGKPLMGALIKIHRTDQKWDATVKTDKKGHYIHTGVPSSGVFDLNCEVNGKLADKLNGYKSTLNDHPPVDFDLRKSASMQSSNQAAMQKALETGQISDDLKRQMTPEQRAQLEKQVAEEGAKMKKKKALNDSFNDGVTALQAKQWDLAVSNLEKAAELDSQQPAVFANLGDAYIGLATTKTGPEYDANMDKGMKAYAKSLELNPDDAAAHNNYALALAKAKKYPEMEAELRKAAELDPATAFSRFYNLGALLKNNNQTDAAAKAFKMAIDAAPDNPKNAESYFQYGVGLAGLATQADGKYVLAPGTLEAFQKYLELAPAGPNAAASKDMLKELGGTIETSFKDPKAPVTPAKKKK